MQPKPDDKYFKKTYQNQSQLDFGRADNQQNQDPRFPRKQAP